jgi:hypothetical protein
MSPGTNVPPSTTLTMQELAFYKKKLEKKKKN